jgi:hypothetical protein
MSAGFIFIGFIMPGIIPGIPKGMPPKGIPPIGLGISCCCSWNLDEL